MITREELIMLYSGPDDSPTQWQTVGQIAASLGVSFDYMMGVMYGYGIEPRSPEKEELKLICNVLQTSFRMVEEIHFTCLANIGGFVVDFFIIHDLIGIKLDNEVSGKDTVTVHSGNNRILKIGMGYSGTGIQGEHTILENTLRDMGVTTRYIREIDDEDGDTW